MSSQIIFYDKSACDIDNSSVVTTITDAIATNTGSSFVSYIYNRNNNSAWLTTGSTDAANTQIDIDFGQGYDLTDIILVKHNFKAYTIQYDDGGYTDFSTAISETTNTDETTNHSFTQVEVQKIRIIITGCMVVDADKVLRQIICTNKLGQFNGWPMIKAPTSSTNKRKDLMLSGKINITEGIGSFNVTLEVSSLSDTTDLALIESLYTRRKPSLLWLCGGDESQFNYASIGYRKEDLYLVRPIDEYDAELYKGIYTAGQKISIKLGEVID